MRALTLSAQLCTNQIVNIAGDFLGDGADGDVYLVKNDTSKVIKFCKLYEDNDLFEANFKSIIDVLSFLEKKSINTFAKVFSHGVLGTFDRKQIYYLDNKALEHQQKFTLYYYIMERLNKISEDEKRIFHSIICHEDSGTPKDLSLSTIDKMLDGMGRALDFDKKKVMFFCRNIRNLPVHHNDIHKRNIMKDNDGNFKLVDFDRSSLNTFQ